MSKFKFKNNGDQIVLAGGEIVHAGNLTDEKYEELIKLNPKHADQFEAAGNKPTAPTKAEK